ncbi:MAG TPA: pyridoxal-phosphate dependent enzyme [Rudaea sp.]|nr:pyridoxal-phosphate dependent enzyme [Rudaea sp.]
MRIARHAHITPVMGSTTLDELAGCRMLFKCENFQRVGAFKFRGACNAVWALSDAVAVRGVVTHSSGNHGAALALAARTRGIPAHVVVPEGAVASKVAAIKAYGATVHTCAATLAARETAAQQVVQATNATLVHPFTNEDVIAGQGTAALELIRATETLDALIAPIGGGGLMAGTAMAATTLLPQIKLFAAEPEGAADAFESLRRNERVVDIVPDTICDGLRAAIGPINFDLLRKHNVSVLKVGDDETIAAMRLIWERMKIVVEPSSAVALAAILHHRQRFAGRRIGIILTGGNVDLDQLPWRQ